MSDYKAVGVHVFAGGFTQGVQRVMPVVGQLETGDFGKETVERGLRLPWVARPSSRPRVGWPHMDAQFAYGNPRCTGFSCITGGYGDEVHGSWAKQTIDIHQFSDYVVNHGGIDIAVWESVQQAYSTGRELIDYLVKEVYAPHNYRIAHVFLDARSFNNAQSRKRYFFVAYKDDRNFNVEPPSYVRERPDYVTVYDAIGHLRDRETHEDVHGTTDYDRDTYLKLSQAEYDVLPYLPNGWNVNTLAKYGRRYLCDAWKIAWDGRSSEMPFSMHCVHRMQWMRPYPTIHSSACRFIHPQLHRPATIGETAAAMGWYDDTIPVGKHPIAQIAKGVVPEIGRWLAQQAVTYLDGSWGDEDWESSYDHVTGAWTGRDTHGQREKVFNLTRYVPTQFDIDRFPPEIRRTPHRFNMDANGRLRCSWDEVEREYLTYTAEDKFHQLQGLIAREVA